MKILTVPSRPFLARAIVVILAALAFLLSVTARPAEEEGPPQSGRVVLPVTVEDASGRPVADLAAADFRVFEDGAEQKIIEVSSGPAPLSVAILVDAELREQAALQFRSSISSLAGALTESDEASVFSVGSSFQLATGFTANRDTVASAIQRIASDSLRTGNDPGQTSEPFAFSVPMINGQPVGGGTAPGPPPMVSVGGHSRDLEQAVFSALRMLDARDSQRRKVILLISNGTNPSRGHEMETALLGELHGADAVFYAISLTAVAPGLQGPLWRYATATGGAVYHGARRNILEQQYARIAEQARYMYLLAYRPPAPLPSSPLYHRIEVRVARSQCKVLARDGYIATPKT